MIGEHGAILYLVPHMNDGLLTLAYLVYYHIHLLTLGFKVGVTFRHKHLINHNLPTLFFSFSFRNFQESNSSYNH